MTLAVPLFVIQDVDDTKRICVAVFVWVKPLAAGWFFGGMGAVLLAGWAGLIFAR